MRPSSRGSGIPGTAQGGGGVPGTSAGGGARPGSGWRLKTGAAVSGPGTQAAQGIALSANINVSDRPVTGQGMKGLKAQGGPSGRLVEDQSFYVGLLRKKISDVTAESQRLREETEGSSKENAQFAQLEKKFDALLKNKETLEGQLADYNLALDKTRTSTDPEDVQQMAYQMAERNRHNAEELDRIFMMRKQRENDTLQIEEQIEKYHRAVQERINSLEPGKQRAYGELSNRRRELEERIMQTENKLNEVNQRVRQFESDEKGHMHRKEYMSLEKQIQSLRRDLDDVQEEIAIAELDPKEAHQKFVNRVNQHKQATKAMEDRIAAAKEDVLSMKRNLEELTSSTPSADDDGSEAAKYELLMKRDQDMTAFIDKFDESRQEILEQQQAARATIVALLEHVGLNIDETTHMPSQEALGEMEDAKSFKERNLITAQKTMENLQAERRKREKELETLRTSEPKLISEIASLKEEIMRMNSELRDFEDVDGVRRRYERNKVSLMELHSSYIKRRDGMRQQMQSVSAEYEGVKKMLAANETARELEETERRLKQSEKVIFELREFIESKGRETDYMSLKMNCLKIADNLNTATIRANKNVGGLLQSQQAKW